MSGDTPPALKLRRPVLVTGGAGFIGSNLADRLARDGHDVLVYDALARPGVERNLAWLRARHPRRVSAITADIRDQDALRAALRDAQAVFHLAAQVAVTTSLTDPAEDFGVNLGGTFALLDLLRRRPVPLVFASTNKVYGNLAGVALDRQGEAWRPRALDLAMHGVGETQPLDFHAPYGCSKGAADQYVLDFARSLGVPGTVLRMSCIYGERQLGTEDQGWVAHFLRQALRGEPITIYGDGSQVRDVLHVDDAVDAYLAAWGRIGRVAGRAYNLGGGPSNAVSLRELLREAEQLVGRPIELRFADWRAGDQRWFVADTRRARAELGLAPPLPWRAGIRQLLGWLQEEMGEGAGAARRAR